MKLLQPSEIAPKSAWRVWARALRGTVLVSSLSQQIVEQLLCWPTFQQATHILSYTAFDSEIDLSPLLETGKALYLTRTPAVDKELTIHRFDVGALEPHPYGYLQPPADAEVIAPGKIDLALIPGLCFDYQGARLGYGLGYYDRLLSKLHPDVPRVGVTAAALFVTCLPSGPFDAPMTHIVTEEGLYDARRANNDGSHGAPDSS